MLQDLFFKKIPEVADKVALAKEYNKKGLKLTVACRLLHLWRTSCYPKKKSQNNDKEVYRLAKKLGLLQTYVKHTE